MAQRLTSSLASVSDALMRGAVPALAWHLPFPTDWRILLQFDQRGQRGQVRHGEPARPRSVAGRHLGACIRCLSAPVQPRDEN